MRSSIIIDNLLELGANEDFAPFTRLTSAEDNDLVEEDRRAGSGTSSSSVSSSNSSLISGLRSTPRIKPPSLSEISFSEGPSKEPEEGKQFFF